MSITKSLYEALRTTFGHYKILLPTSLKKCCFTVSAKDNIDKNATTNLIRSHFHGTDLSLFQLLNHENQGESLDYDGFTDAVYNIKKLAPLSAEYTQLRKVYRSSGELFAPLCRFNYEDLFEYSKLSSAKTEEQQWLKQLASFARSIIYKRNASSLPMSKILIFCFHCFGIESIRLTCRFIQCI